MQTSLQFHQKIPQYKEMRYRSQCIPVQPYPVCWTYPCPQITYFPGTSTRSIFNLLNSFRFHPTISREAWPWTQPQRQAVLPRNNDHKPKISGSPCTKSLGPAGYSRPHLVRKSRPAGFCVALSRSPPSSRCKTTPMYHIHRFSAAHTSSNFTMPSLPWT